MSTQVATQQEQTAHDVMRGQVHKIEISDVLPEHISEEKFRRVAMTAINQNQDLYQCDRGSLLAALLNAATDGLLPDGREAALVLFGRKAVYMPMIAGIYKKVRNSGEISTLSSHVVYENDEFEYWIDESGPHLRHTPLMGDDRGKATGVYAVCKLKDDSVEIETMSVAQVEEVRAVSRTKGGPWNDWWDEMARKTVVRRLSKRLPMSSDQERLIRRDDSMYDLEQKPAVEAPPRPQRLDYKYDSPPQGEDSDKRFRQTMNETGSASGGTEGAPTPQGEAAAEQAPNAAPAEPAPGREGDSAGLTFFIDDHVVLYSSDGEEVKRYQRAGNYFKAVLALIKLDPDANAMLELNRPGFKIFTDPNPALLEDAQACWQAVIDAETETAQGSAA